LHDVAHKVRVKKKKKKGPGSLPDADTHTTTAHTSHFPLPTCIHPAHHTKRSQDLICFFQGHRLGKGICAHVQGEKEYPLLPANRHCAWHW
jgi:hypothetical protein